MAWSRSVRSFSGNQFRRAIIRRNATGDTNEGEAWSPIPPERSGFSAARLEQAKRYFEEIGGDACVVVQGGYLVVAWGDVSKPIPNRSIRKSYLNALLGNREALAPEIVVRFGRAPASKVLSQWLAAMDMPVFQVGGPGVIDPEPGPSP